jgi:hypothetical protein
MSPIHFDFLRAAFEASGYRFELLPSVDTAAVDEGLKYVNNDACYPSIIVTGQLIEAVNRAVRYKQARLHHHADGRRMPRVQLYQLYPQSACRRGVRAYTRDFAQRGGA